jgi:dolichol-phosphate mannosyltransferase
LTAAGHPSVAIVVPAYNEELNLPRLFAEIEDHARAWGFSPGIVVVDDGSSDRTASLAAGYTGPLTVSLVRQGRNRGVAAALVAGIEEAVADPACELVAMIEADTTSDLTALPAMIAAIEAGADVAQGSVRTGSGHMEGVSRLRILTSWGANVLLRVAAGSSLGTISNLYRVVRAQTLRDALAAGPVLLREPGFAGVSELVLTLAARGARVVEVPVVLDASKRVDHTKIRFSQTIVAYVRVAGRATASRLRSR